MGWRANAHSFSPEALIFFPFSQSSEGCTWRRFANPTRRVAFSRSGHLLLHGQTPNASSKRAWFSSVRGHGRAMEEMALAFCFTGQSRKTSSSQRACHLGRTSRAFIVDSPGACCLVLCAPHNPTPTQSLPGGNGPPSHRHWPLAGSWRLNAKAAAENGSGRFFQKFPEAPQCPSTPVMV